jgi:hypothetical protein
VFNDKIAESGLSMFCFKFNNDLAFLFPFFSSMRKCEIEVDKSTASTKEQINEVTKANNK